MPDEGRIATGRIATTGRIQFPAAVRRHLQKRYRKTLEEGDFLDWVVNKDGDVVVRPA